MFRWEKTMQIDIEINSARNALSRCFKLYNFFHKLQIFHCHICWRLSSYQLFKSFFIKHCFQLLQNVTWTNKIMYEIRHKCYNLFRMHGDQSFLMYFFETVLSREHEGKVKKLFEKISFWGITLSVSHKHVPDLKHLNTSAPPIQQGLSS